MSDKIVNPKTGRKIKKFGMLYYQLIQSGHIADDCKKQAVVKPKKPKKEKKQKFMKIKIVKKKPPQPTFHIYSAPENMLLDEPPQKPTRVVPPPPDTVIPSSPQKNQTSINKFVSRKKPKKPKKSKTNKTAKEIIQEIKTTPLSVITGSADDPMRAGRDRALALMRDTSLEDMIASLKKKSTGPTRKAPSRPQKVNRQTFSMPKKTQTRKVTKTGQGPSRQAPTRAKAEYDAAGREVIRRRGKRIEQTIAGKKARGPLKKKPVLSFAQATKGTNKIAGLSFAQMVSKGRSARRFT